MLSYQHLKADNFTLTTEITAGQSVIKGIIFISNYVWTSGFIIFLLIFFLPKTCVSLRCPNTLLDILVLGWISSRDGRPWPSFGRPAVKQSDLRFWGFSTSSFKTLTIMARNLLEIYLTSFYVLVVRSCHSCCHVYFIFKHSSLRQVVSTGCVTSDFLL